MDFFPVQINENFRRVSCDGERATLRYVGPVPPTSGLWLGVEWDNPERGKHDGSHNGVQYFTCSHPTGGSFVRPAKVTFGVDFLTADSVYLLLLNGLAQTDFVMNVWSCVFIMFWAFFVFSFQKLQSVVLSGFEVNGPGAAGEIRTTLYNVCWLDLSGTLLSRWEDVAAITEQLDKLEGLQLHRNRLTLPSEPSVHSQAFCNLKTLALNQCQLTWPQILKCATMWPQLEELILEANDITELQRNKLILMTSLFNFQWFVVDELAKLSSLVRFSCQGNRLLSKDGNPNTARQMVIAKLEQLVFLNNCTIISDERRGAELDYIKMFGEEWLKAGGPGQPNADFIKQHPCYQKLIDKYGAPDESELKKPQPFALKNQLIKITFLFPNDPDRKPIEKKLPASMDVQKVKGLLHRMLKVPAADLKLSYKTSKKAGVEFDIDNDQKTLQFFSVEDGDRVLVRWS
uniref:Tubulin-specific chaperone E n=1 Tax=Oryzias sinensis TaxID=183150 RepID=A0A8C7YWW7_9TELE